MDCSVQQIVEQASDKLCLGDDLVLCEVKSSGGKMIISYERNCQLYIQCFNMVKEDIIYPHR